MLGETAKTVANRGFLTETCGRIETFVSVTKQRTGVISTRDRFIFSPEGIWGVLRSRFVCAGLEAAGGKQLMGFESSLMELLDGLAPKCPALKRILDGDAFSER